MDDKLLLYLNNLVPERTDLILEMEQYAKEHDVPIMELPSLELLLQVIRIQGPVKILEIGTAIGYSALRMLEASPDAHIVTIERDEQRIEKARQFIKLAKKEQQITILAGDALQLEAEVAKFGQFDLLFIDAAKYQYEKFFNIYEKYVVKNGIVITDNILFKGLVYNDDLVNKRAKGIVKRLRTFTTNLMEHPNYDTSVVPIGDGVAISRKREG